MRREFLKIFRADLKAELYGLVSVLGGLGVIALFKPSQRKVVPRRGETGLLGDGLFADLDAFVVLAIHIVGRAEGRHGLNKLAIPFEGLLKGGDGLFRLAALEMDETDVAPRHRELARQLAASSL